jgi:hypothetical protein
MGESSGIGGFYGNYSESTVPYCPRKKLHPPGSDVLAREAATGGARQQHQQPFAVNAQVAPYVSEGLGKLGLRQSFWIYVIRSAISWWLSCACRLIWKISFR